MEISAEQMALIKTHLRVDSDAEDSLITAYASAAIDYVELFCDGALVEALTPPAEGEASPREILFTPGIWAAIPIGWFLADFVGYGYYFLRRQRLLSPAPPGKTD